MKKYKVINIILDINEKLTFDYWNIFMCNENVPATVRLDFPHQNKCNYGLKNFMLGKDMRRCIGFRKERILVDDKYTNGLVIASESIGNIQMLIAQVFLTHAVQLQILQFHSSLIDFHNQGLMFLGPSGIGKTTQAELWNKYRDALIINGDIVFVQETPDAFLGWGTPWHGSSPYCENTSVPLKAMIVLKQAPENSIRELTGFEKVTAVSNNVFYPRWLENGMELCLETLDHLLSRIPVYELSCRPDEEAVKLTEETIFGSGSVSD